MNKRKKSTKKNLLATMFPNDILIEILSRLPVKSLVRFMCVSKPWLKLITSPTFVKSHLNKSAEINPKIIFGTYEDTYSIDYETSCYEPKPYDSPPESNMPEVGCCNGLVCISDKAYYMQLWNPATEEYVSVPYAFIEEELLNGELDEYKCEVVMGFGYDPEAEQYKVVSSVFFYNDSEQTEFKQCEVRVCTLGTKVWRKIGEPPCCLRNRHMVPQVNGALHWLGRSAVGSKVSDSNKIVSFDLGSEKFSIVPSVDEAGNIEVDVTLGVLQGCLCMLVGQKGEYSDKKIDVWLMKDYGMKESWTKLFSIGMPISGKEFSSIEPLALRSTGEMLLKSAAELYLYDDANKEVTTHSICDIPDECYIAHTYTESLVSIASFIGSEDEESD